MFHSYVTTAAKRPDGKGAKAVDVDRAMFLMDDELKHQALAWAEKNWPAIEKDGGSTLAQAFWDYYCSRHYEKFGESFIPQIDPHWDT